VEENGEIMGKLSEKPRNETKSEKNAPTEDAHKGLCPRTPAGLQGPIRVWQVVVFFHIFYGN
jgi:hypothetical protein